MMNHRLMSLSYVVAVLVLALSALALPSYAGSQTPTTPQRSLANASLAASGSTIPVTGSAELVSQIGGQTNAIDIEGNYAFIGVQRRLVILDISDATQPTFVGQSALLSGVVNDVAISGTFAYVAAGVGGLSILDVSNPVTPTLSGGYTSEHSYATHVTLEGQRIYLSTNNFYPDPPRSGGGSLVVLERTGTAPVFVGAFHFYSDSRVSEAPGEVVVTNNHAYVARFGTHGGGLTILDISADFPREVGSFDMTPGYSDIALQGDYAYLAGGPGLHIFNVSDPASPTPVNHQYEGREVRDVEVVDNVAYVLKHGDTPSIFDEWNLRALDITDPEETRELARFDFWGRPQEIELVNERVYIADRGVRTVDITNPAEPMLAGSYHIPDILQEAVLSNGYLYALENDVFDAEDSIVTQTLRIFNASDPAAPFEVSTVPVSGEPPLEFTLEGHYIYLYDSLLNTQVIDVSDPESPQKVGEMHGLGYGTAAPFLDVSGNYAYVASCCGEDPNGHLEIYDLSDPAHPARRGSYVSPYSPTGLQVQGTTAYLSGWDNDGTALEILDVSDPDNPVRVGVLENLGGTEWEIVGKYVYSASGGGVDVYDVNQPSAPQHVGSLPFEARNLVQSGEYLYALTPEGLQTVDVSNPAAPEMDTFYRIPIQLGSVFAVEGAYLYGTEGQAALSILRLIEPEELAANNVYLPLVQSGFTGSTTAR